MTHVWPGFGDAPVPTLLSVICKPEAVVMGFPALWAIAGSNEVLRMTADAVSSENTATAPAVRRFGIFSPCCDGSVFLAQASRDRLAPGRRQSTSAARRIERDMKSGLYSIHIRMLDGVKG